MFAVIDCGTTNTRIYIIDGDGRIIGQAAHKIGVKDVAVAGSNQVLKDGLCTTMFEAALDAGITVEHIDFAIASGMITSEIGLMEIPHMEAPASIDDLANNAVIVRDAKVFPLDMPVIFVRGIRNRTQGKPVFQDISALDFMRGEEVQMMGILSEISPALPLNVVVLSSHTKMIHIDAQGRIAGSITTVSGQIYESVRQTIIAKALNITATDIPVSISNEEILDVAYQAVAKGGLLRSLLMPRFMHTLMCSAQSERSLFVDAVIAADDMGILDECKNIGFWSTAGFLLVGHPDRCAIYEKFIPRKLGHDARISAIHDPEIIASFTVSGAVAVAERILCQKKLG